MLTDGSHTFVTAHTFLSHLECLGLASFALRMNRGKVTAKMHALQMQITFHYAMPSTPVELELLT